MLYNSIMPKPNRPPPATPQPPPPLLAVQGLTIIGSSDDHAHTIIDKVNLTLQRGEVLGLIGESGAGKSTLGLACMGFTRDGCHIGGGSIKFDGIPLTRPAPRMHRKLLGRRIAYVAQSAAASFNPAHKIILQHIEAPRIHRLMGKADAMRDAIALYKKMRLPQPEVIGFRYPHQVSGGQLQRAMTAMAMACRPDLIIFDEPTTALDVTTQIDVLAAIRGIVRQFNTAAIYISHDLAVVAQMADRIKVLRYGREVEEASTRAMLKNPRASYTKSLWAVRQFKRPPSIIPKGDSVPLIALDGVTAAYGVGLGKRNRKTKHKHNYKHKPILRDVCFAIHPGQTVAVVGESGSGKSTAARSITGLLPPLGGRILYRGTPLPSHFSRRDRQQLRQIQMIYQMADTALNPRRKISDIIGRPVEFYLGLTGKDKRKKVAALMEAIEMEPTTYLNRLPSELSGGQKQRIGIARALAAEPEFIICDEVTSALDQLVAEGILKLLVRLQQQHGLAYMFITHDLATVRAIADQVVIMKDGEVIEAGEKNEVLTPPHHPYTSLLLRSVPEMDPNWLTNMLAARGHGTNGRGSAIL